jgi:glutathione peroxidase
MDRRSTLLVLPALLLLSIAAGAPAPVSVYDFELKRIDGRAESLSAYRGEVLLLVNVASKCGFTPQYEGLEALYEKYRDRGLVVLGFPANDFGAQEPGTNEEIAEFCRATWSVEFPMFEKISVKGSEQHPLYAFITSRPPPIGGEIEWNFQKFLVDREGRLVERFSPRTRPLDPALVARVEALLAAPKAPADGS